MALVQAPPNRNEKSRSTCRLRPRGASSQTAQKGRVTDPEKQPKAVALRPAPSKPKAVVPHRQALRVKARGRQGGWSASSSLRSTQNHNDATTSSWAAPASR